MIRKEPGMPRKLQGQAGVALVTVLLAGAVLTAVTSTAAFMTIREFAATDDDQQSSRALSLAESGLDRMIIAMKSKEWGDLATAGCGTTPAFTVTGKLDEGTSAEAEFTATVVNTNCPSTTPRPDQEQRLRIESTGETNDASRIVEQRVDITSATLPIGVFAETFAAVGGVGNGEFRNLSLITPGNVSGREKLETVGFDIWYSQDDFYGNGNVGVCSSASETTTSGACTIANSLPAAVHAGGTITCDSANTCNPGSNPPVEHTTPGTAGTVDNNLSDGIGRWNLNCTSNDAGGTPNSAWDGSSNGGPTTNLVCTNNSMGKAPTSLFTASLAAQLQPSPSLEEDDYDFLRERAELQGLTCVQVGNGVDCTSWNGEVIDSPITNQELVDAELPDDFVIFAEFPIPPANTPTTSLPTLTINAELGDCSDDQTTFVVIRNGNVTLGSNQGIAGGVIAEDGRVDVGGGAIIHGTVIAQELTFRGSSDFLMNDCSLNALSFPFINVSAGAWRELDR